MEIDEWEIFCVCEGVYCVGIFFVGVFNFFVGFEVVMVYLCDEYDWCFFCGECGGDFFEVGCVGFDGIFFYVVVVEL